MEKKLLIFLLLFGLLLVTGCGSNGKLKGVKNINKQNIFNQTEEKYYVYFHRLDCPDCDEAAPAVINYMNIIKEYSGCQNKRPVYAVLLYTESEKPGDSVYIYREYDGEGEGKEGTFKVDNITDWKDLYIGATSSLISISPFQGEKTAYFEAQGAEDIMKVLEEQLGDCYK